MVNGNELKRAIISGTNNILSHKSTVDDMNIFPVPDGDTGTNMSMTMSAAVEALERTDESDISKVAALAASALLRGARGNSGVILSLLFRGFSKGLEGLTEANGKDIAKALGDGVDAAYKAVMKPTEGTILTVARMAFEAGERAANTDPDTVYVFEEIYRAAAEALELTPELLPVLKKAGVTDAGGKGLCLIFEGMLSVFKNGTVMQKTGAAANDEDDFFRSAAAEFDSEITFTYCTEFIVGKNKDSGSDLDSSVLRGFLENIGDSMVLVDDDEIIKVHVHTDHPGDVLERALGFGSLLTVKIENMVEQHKNAGAKSEKAVKSKFKKDEKLAAKDPTEEFGFVAVGAGEGLTELFKDLGVLHVVSGGQSMNPSTDNILEAVLATPAKNVFVLPNNKNIIMSAQQTKSLVSDRNVIVVPTKTIPQGMSALLAFDDGLSAESNETLMIEATSNVSTGQVTYAARDSEFGSNKIKEGQIIALENGKLTFTESTPVNAVYKLAKNMIKRDSSFVTLIYGEGISQEEADKAVNMIKAKISSHIDITLINGGQPVYYFILSVE